MNSLLTKLNYKDHKRIAIIKADDIFIDSLTQDLSGVVIDKNIDPRYPYGFIIIFVKTKDEIEHFSPIALHNLMDDGILWFCYPKKSSKKYKADFDRDHGWDDLNNSGFYGIRMISIDADWSAVRFRNKKYIKSTSDRFQNNV